MSKKGINPNQVVVALRVAAPRPGIQQAVNVAGQSLSSSNLVATRLEMLPEASTLQQRAVLSSTFQDTTGNQNAYRSTSKATPELTVVLSREEASTPVFTASLSAT